MQAHLLRLLNVLRTARPGGHSCFTPGDFCYRWATETDPVSPPLVNIWENERGDDIGGAWLSGDHLHILTRMESERLRLEILAWGEAQMRATGRAESLRIPIAASSHAWERLLARRGYQSGAPVLVQHAHELDTVAVPAMPDGYRLGHVQNARQETGWATAYRAAFAPEEMTAEVRRAVSASPLYRPELDLVALDEEGAVAAFALAWLDPVSATGTFEPIGCVPAQQRRGLSRALLLAGLRRLQRLGARRAFVTTTRRRVPANRLYASSGFQVESSSRTWSKPQAG